MPSSPGVYWFRDEADKILYIGKAKNLKNRLASYTRIKQALPKTKRLIHQTHAVSYQIVDSELTALLVEAELIRIHQPPYNVLLKDDKSPLYLIITKQTFPQLKIIRKSDIPTQGAYLRLFGPYPSARQLKRVLTLVRHIFPWCDAPNQPAKHPKACFYYHLHQCPGACIQAISPTDYRRIINQLIRFLQGKHQQIIHQLTKQAITAANQQDFETASKHKQTITAINQVIGTYRLRSQAHQLPQLTQDVAYQRLINLKQILANNNLNLPFLNRIETYDIATLSGADTTAAMVVALKGELTPSEYRHFSIPHQTKPNDVAMLIQTLNRRLKHPEWDFPQLIILDGGIPQVRGVTQALKTDIPIIGLAKKPDRIVLMQSDLRFITVPLINLADPGCQLVLQLRDEAHRFTRRLHHKHSTKRLLNQTN